MAFQSVPLVAEVVIKFKVAQQDENNILHFKFATEPTAGELQTLAETVGDWAHDEYLPLTGADCQYVETTTRSLTASTSYQGIHTTGSGDSGHASACLPTNVSKAFTIRTALIGRNARGRMFFAGLPTDALSGRDYVTQDFVDDVIDALELLKLAVEALSWVWVIVSRYAAGVKRPTGVTYEVTSFGTSNLTTDSMRNRLPTS
jgi:hypothetical protein